MNILLVQRYNACLISKVLPYNPIGSVPINVTPPKKTELDDIDDDIDDDLPFLKTSVGGLSHDRDYKKYSYINVPTTVCKRKRNHMYFCSNRKEYQDDYCNLKFLRNKEYDNFITEDSELIKNSYNDAFSSVSSVLMEVSIKRSDDKLIIKTYHAEKRRDFNRKYFKKYSRTKTLSINLKTGNFIIGSYGNDRTKFKQNSFKDLLEVFNRFEHYLVQSPFGDNNDEYLKTFNHQKVLDVLYNEIFQEIGGDVRIDSPSEIDMVDLIFKFFIKKKNIKVNNDFVNIFVNYYPTEKFLKKNERKLVLSLLDYFGIKSNVGVKIIHKYNITHPEPFIKICKLFGDGFEKYVNMINWDKIRKPIGKLEKYTLDYNSDDKYNFEHFNCRYNLSTKEKGNIIKVINSCEVLDKGFVREILDHLNMINMVREYYPNEFFSPENEDSFDKHHLSLSKIVNKIKQKTIKTYVYDDNFLNKIEEPIIINGVIFQPLVLKSQEDYSSEGAFMHHCVASYFNSPYRKPLIISLRCNDDADRVTCEYNVVTGNLNQSKSFQNAKPPEYFVEPLDILNERILKVKDKQMLLPVTIISTPNVVNGIEVNESKQQEVVDDIFW